MFCCEIRETFRIVFLQKTDEWLLLTKGHASKMERENVRERVEVVERNKDGPFLSFLQFQWIASVRERKPG